MLRGAASGPPHATPTPPPPPHTTCSTLQAHSTTTTDVATPQLRHLPPPCFTLRPTPNGTTNVATPQQQHHNNNNSAASPPCFTHPQAHAADKPASGAPAVASRQALVEMMAKRPADVAMGLAGKDLPEATM